MRQATAVALTLPTFAALLCASTFIHPNVLGAFLAPLWFLGLVLTILGMAVALKHREGTPRTTWSLLICACAAQAMIAAAVGVTAK